MEPCVETDSPPLPEPPPGISLRPILEPDHWRRLLPSSLASAFLHAFFLMLFALASVAPFVPPPVKPPIDTRVTADEERTYEVARVDPPKPKPPEPTNLAADGGLPQKPEIEIRETAGALDASGGALLPIQQPAKSGKVRGPDVPYVPTPQLVVDEMLRLARVQGGEIVMDLGCGDGRIPITAAKNYNARGFGYDIDAERIKEARDNASKQGLANRVVFEQRDIFLLDLSRADVVTFYLLPSLNVKLLPQLQRLKPGARIVSHDFDIAGIKPAQIRRFEVEGQEHTIYLWTVPLIKEDSQPLDSPPPDPGKLTVSEDEVLWNMLGIRATPQAGGGLKVEALKRPGPAARAGVRLGDVLVMLGGFDVASKRAEAVHLIRLRPLEMSFEVRRDQQRIVEWMQPDAWDR